MKNHLNRRQLLAAAGLTLAGMNRRVVGANEKVIVGVMGLSRGRALAETFAGQPQVQVRYVCDVDSQRADACAVAVGKITGTPATPIGDFRRILDDREVDGLICAAPNHWHGPATIMACAAGKHVYVEKPCCHNPQEGQWMVAAARKHKRVVQMGNQRRTWPTIVEGIQRLHEGVIGRLYYSRSWYAASRGSIGKGLEAPIPAHLDYELWQGPAARRPYRSNVIPYNWHWFWHWGNGELGNNGVHSVDLSRWGLGVDYPSRVTSSGGRYAFNDDQETPDTHVVTFDFEGGKTILWEGLSCNLHGLDETGFGVSFHGEGGSLVLRDSGYKIYDPNHKLIQEKPGEGGEAGHVGNFLQALRTGDPGSLNSEIEQGHKSTLLCHLGNIAQRTGRALRCDPKDGAILENPEAAKLWSREYAKGWEPKF